MMRLLPASSVPDWTVETGMNSKARFHPFQTVVLSSLDFNQYKNSLIVKRSGTQVVGAEHSSFIP